MECPKCGYVLGPFDADCPKCARGPVVTAPVSSKSDDEVLAAVDRIAPTVQKRVEKEAAPRYEPDLGWPLTILLWLAIAMGVVNLVLGDLWSVAIIAAAIGMLREKRWGFYVYCLFGARPAVTAVLVGLTGKSLLTIIAVAPAIAIFILALQRWDRFE